VLASTQGAPSIRENRSARQKFRRAPGVKRLSEEALERGWTLAVASTSAQESVDAVLRRAMGEATAARFALVLAGDVVKAKKPAPDIYLLAAERLGVSPAECVVVEDSNNGLRRLARPPCGAWLPCPATRARRIFPSRHRS